jgi:hypothetical protein
MSTPIPVGAIVRITHLPPYLKTAETMPMLRSATLLQVGEEGRVVGLRPAGYYAIRFANGTFLLDRQYLDVTPSSEP